MLRWYHGYTIIGEVLTLSGAISNFLDRVVYGGVVDFIEISIIWLVLACFQYS